MDKIAVEVFELKIIKKEEVVLWIRMGRNGMVFRQGTGKLPSINTQVQAQFGHNIWFHSLITSLPDNLFAQPILPKPAISAASHAGYALKFYSDCDTIPSGGLHIEIAPNSAFPHPLQPLLDEVKAHMLSLTDTMYFDGVLYAALGYKSNLLPLETSVSVFDSSSEKKQELERYLLQLVQYYGPSALKKHAARKLFALDDEYYLLQIQNAAGTDALHFVPRNHIHVADSEQNTKTAKEAQPRKPWWRFWK
jgi:hypothetical protein